MFRGGIKKSHRGRHSAAPQSTRLELGIGTFINEEGGYTSVAVAFSLLVCLALVVSAVSIGWTQNRASHVQSVADATALAGENVVASYVIIAQTIDACELTLGLAGMVMLGVGLVVSAIPGMSTVEAQTVQTGTNVLDARKSFATSAAHGLESLEKTLPFAIIVRSSTIPAQNDEGELHYVGCSIPFPQTSQTDFSGIDTTIDTDSVKQSASELQQESDKAKRAKDKVRDACYEEWLADCGDNPRNLYERAGTLASLSPLQNPYYPNPDSWSFSAPLRRARSYYAQRLAQETPLDESIDERADSAYRAKFYAYVSQKVQGSYFIQHEDGTVESSFSDLPKNTQELRETSLYTDICWPCSLEESGLVVHAIPDCPGNVGSFAGLASIEELELGLVSSCPVCSISAASLGKVAAASTSIDTGFEFFWKKIVEASRSYTAACDELAEAERALRTISRNSAQAFNTALEALTVPRPHLCPPGTWGCVGVVSRTSSSRAPAQLDGLFVSGMQLPPGSVVSAATLAPDSAANGNDSLTRLFETLSDHMASGPGSVLGSIGSLWGSLLVGYGSTADGLSTAADSALSHLEGVPAAGAASWLRNKITDIVKRAGFELADLRLRKPVRTHTQNVLSQAGLGDATTVHELVEKLPSTNDPVALAHAFGQQVVNDLGTGQFTVAELPIFWTQESIPFTINIRELLGAIA